jgi:predicted murein hydrolase (TIGR00659 family)
MLKPATVAFAIPLYKYYPVLIKYAREIVIGIVLGSLAAILVTMLLAVLWNMSAQIIISLAPHSITTPLAMIVAENLGGIPSLTAVFVIITGMCGPAFGPFLIKKLKISDPIAQGTILGMATHAVGTSAAFELSSLAGTASTVSMILAAIFTVLLAPFVIPLFLKLLGY